MNAMAMEQAVETTLESDHNTDGAEPVSSALDAEALRQDFPILQQAVNGKPVVYLDSAASAHKPQVVIDAVSNLYATSYANVHRGVHDLSQRATEAYEAVRETVRAHLNAENENEIVFVRGATEGINLVANTWGQANLKAGDEILITAMEHHANIVPWQMLCQRTGALLRVVPMNDQGELLDDEYRRLLNDRTAIVALSHISNALGTINPVREMTAEAHAAGAVVLLDSAQAVPHQRLDVRDLDCDFLVFSGHKVFGPTGTGVLYGKASVLADMPPWEGGGDMIRQVTFEKTTYADPPQRFEAGTPNIAGFVGLGAALDYVNAIGLDRIAAWEAELLDYGTQLLTQIDGLRLIGTAKHKAGVLSFVMDCAHSHDVGTILNADGVAVRTGHHCAQPVMQRFGIAATTRASLSFYNTKADLDALASALGKVKMVFG